MLGIRTTLSLAILACALPGRAQTTQAKDADLRGKLRGVVRDIDGKNVANAVVELWLRPCANYVPIGPQDSVETKTDARGRFSASILRGYAYSAVATWTAGDGEARQSKLHEGCWADALVRLEQRKKVGWTEMEATLTFDRDGYGLHGDVRATFFVDGVNPRVLDDSSYDSGVTRQVRIPFSDDRGRFAVLVRDDRGPIHQTTLSAYVKGRNWRYAIRKGEPLAFRVVDRTGAPIEGAEIASMLVSRAGWRVDAVTDAGGEALSHSTTRTPTRWTVRVRAPGYRESLAFRSGTRGNLNGQIANPWTEQSTLQITLEKQAARTGRLLDSAGRGIAGVGVVLARGLTLKTAPNSSQGFSRTREIFVTDEEGRFVVPALAQAEDASWNAVLPPDVLRRASAKLESGARPPAAVDLTPSGKPGEDGTHPPVVDLREWTARPYSIRLQGNLPARSAAVVPVRDLVANRDRALARAVRTDRRGACVLFDRGAKSEHVALLEGKGWARLAATDLEPDADGVQRIELAPFTERRVRILDRSGRPVAGATVSITGSSWSGSGIEIDIARALNAIGLSATSDEDGRMTLWSIEVPRLSHRLRFRKGSASAKQPLPPPSTEVWVVELSG